MCDKTRYDELAKQVAEVKAILLEHAPVDEALTDIYKGSARMAKAIVRTAQVFMALTIIFGGLYAAIQGIIHWRPH